MSTADWFWIAYGRGAQAKAAGESKRTNYYTYGTVRYDAWNDGWEGRP